MSNALGDATVRGVRWLALMRVVSEAIGVIALVVLARLVSPADFGRSAVALIFVMVGIRLTFDGFASALVQLPSIDDVDRSTAMLTSIAGGLILSIGVYALAGPVWTPIFGHQTAGLIQLAAPAAFIASLGATSRALVWRNLDFRRVSLIDTVSLFGGSVASVGMAIAGLGATAIVLGALVQTIVGTIMLLSASPPPMPRWSGRAQRPIAGFGVPAALAGLVDAMFMNIDYAILAARLPAAQAGYYYRAFNLGVVYQDKLSRIMTQVAFPVYSRTPDREQLRALHERVARVHAVVIFPFLAALAALAPILIPLVFGPQWKPAIVPTQILAGAGMVAAILTGYPQLMLAIGRPRALMFFNIGMVVGYAAGIFLASRQGLTVVALTVVLLYVLILLGVYRFLLSRHVGISVRRLIPELGPALIGCVALIAVTVALAAALGQEQVPRIVTVAIAGGAGLIVYAAVLRAAFPSSWSDLYTLIVRVFPASERVRLLRPRGAASVTS